MNKRGVVLIFSFFVVVVLLVLLSSFFVKTFNENSLVRRYASSTQALWAAEAGVAESIANCLSSLCSVSGNVGNPPFQASFSAGPPQCLTANNPCDYYGITSTGSVDYPGAAGNITRTVQVTVGGTSFDSQKFKYALNAANDLCFGGNCKGDPTKYVHPDTDGTPCPTGTCWKEFDNTINFTDKFGGHTPAEIKNVATVYTDTTYPVGTNIEGVFWVDVAPGSKLNLTGGCQGCCNATGVLIVNGNVFMSGTYGFCGIIYVLGTLDARGTFDGYGSVVVSSTAGIDTINGTPDFYYDDERVDYALQLLSNSFAQVVSWKEQ